jgi:hypothetical protein
MATCSTSCVIASTTGAILARRGCLAVTYTGNKLAEPNQLRSDRAYSGRSRRREVILWAGQGAMVEHVILFLAANPDGISERKLGEEYAEIQRELKMAPHRDDVRSESRWMVGIEELMAGAAVGTVWFLDRPPQFVPLGGRRSSDTTTAS